MACWCRRRPFLVRGLENTLVKLLLSLEFFDEAGRKRIAIGVWAACCQHGRLWGSCGWARWSCDVQGWALSAVLYCQSYVI